MGTFRPKDLYLTLLFIATAITAAVVFLPTAGQLSEPGLAPLRQSLKDVPMSTQRFRVVGYQRQNFGPGWAPAPAPLSGCTTREAALFHQSDPTTTSQSGTCPTPTGLLFDPYTGAMLELNNATDIEIDHVFPLSAAWDQGAYEWDNATRITFANDPLNLVATSKQANRDKSDSLPEEWMPPDRSARCWYAQRLAAVAKKYRLNLSEADIRVMKKACRLAFIPRG